MTNLSPITLLIDPDEETRKAEMRDARHLHIRHGEKGAEVCVKTDDVVYCNTVRVVSYQEAVDEDDSLHGDDAPGLLVVLLDPEQDAVPGLLLRMPETAHAHVRRHGIEACVKKPGGAGFCESRFVAPVEDDGKGEYDDYDPDEETQGPAPAPAPPPKKVSVVPPPGEPRLLSRTEVASLTEFIFDHPDMVLDSKEEEVITEAFVRHILPHLGFAARPKWRDGDVTEVKSPLVPLGSPDKAVDQGFFIRRGGEWFSTQHPENGGLPDRSVDIALNTGRMSSVEFTK